MNFHFKKEKFLDNRGIEGINTQILPTTQEDFEKMEGAVIPSSLWDSTDDFITNGVGRSLYYENKLAAIAFSAYYIIENDVLELGIETYAECRGKQFGYKAC